MSKNILERELESLKKKILSLSALVEESVQKAVQALNEGNEHKAKEVIDCDEAIDSQEVEVEEDCLKILALHQPVASDLRFVISILKINNDLERVGDLAVNMAKRTIHLIDSNLHQKILDFTPMVEKARWMLAQSLNALVDYNIELARKVLQEDHIVDVLHKQTYELIQAAILKDPANVKALINYLSISRCLERIADYATNIAEDVLYMVEGSIMRHKTNVLPE